MCAAVCGDIDFSCFDQFQETTTTAKLRMATAAAAVPWEANLDLKEDFYSNPFGGHSVLSAKSLELCTENLGSESGSDTAADGIGVFGPFEKKDSSKVVDEDDERSKLGNREKPKTKEVPTSNTFRRFPPPLTTMSGSSSLQVRRHLEGGRLIIEAVETPFRTTYLQAERSEGRLRLCYLTDSDCDSDNQSPQAVEKEDFENPRNEFESGIEEFDGEKNVERFQRLSRCKERRLENEVLCSTWKPVYWPVATS